MMVVDTCVIVDISDRDPVFGERSARILEEHADGGLLIAPVSYKEIRNPLWRYAPACCIGIGIPERLGQERIRRVP